MLPSPKINGVFWSKGESIQHVQELETPRYGDSKQLNGEVASKKLNLRKFSDSMSNFEELEPQLTFSRKMPSVSDIKTDPAGWLKVSNTGDPAKRVLIESHLSEYSIKTKIDPEQSFGPKKLPTPSPVRLTYKRRMASPNARKPTTTSDPFLQVIDGVLQVLQESEANPQTNNRHPKASSAAQLSVKKLINAKQTTNGPSKLGSLSSDRIVTHQQNGSNNNRFRKDVHNSTRTVLDFETQHWIGINEHLVTEPKSKFTSRNNSLALGLRSGISSKNVRNLSVDFIPRRGKLQNELGEHLWRKGSETPRGCPSPLTKSSIVLPYWDGQNSEHTTQLDSELVPELIEENHRLKIQLAAEQKQSLSLKMALVRLRQKLKSREASQSPATGKQILTSNVTQTSDAIPRETQKGFYLGNSRQVGVIDCEPVTQRSFVKRPSKQSQLYGGQNIISGDLTTNPSPVVFSSNFLRQHCANITKPLPTNTLSGSFAQLITNKLRGNPALPAAPKTQKQFTGRQSSGSREHKHKRPT